MDYLSLCLICKDENDYLPEWLDYHILIGVDRFYIYDNESKVSLRESLNDYIERGWVVVVDIPGKAMQLFAYDHCLQTFGPFTFWMGFIDTDEFLVTKTCLDLKELLKNYEDYGGLAVSSLFFGSNGHHKRPAAGQIVSYTRRTHTTFKENELVKSIIQPSRVLIPRSPHDFVYKENTWCVNEGLLRVDLQRFPNYTEKIQLNHYYCRSEREIDQKLGRGNSGAVAWPRKRFDLVNKMSEYEDTNILQNLVAIFEKAGIDTLDLNAVDFVGKMAGIALTRISTPLNMVPPREARSFRPEFTGIEQLKAQMRSSDKQQVCQLLLRMSQMLPHFINPYIDLSVNYLILNDPGASWQVLTRAWQLAPNTYATLLGMTYYFIKTNNYEMAEKSSHLILNIAPHNLICLGFLTEALLGLGRYSEAIKVGVPVVELSAQVGELPDWQGVLLVKKMADYLLENNDNAGAVHLWEAGVLCQPGEVYPVLELARTLLITGDKATARQRLAQAQKMDPKNREVLELLKQFEVGSQRSRRHR